ncbi:hypothetical protein AZKH_1914 [Azoarcus sp. KH32C]|nr:hypothetical protein AZKH_1914 [Azoarcus sp. KH32C]
MGIKQFEVIELSYLFESMESAQKVMQGPIGKQLLKSLEPKGVVGLAGRAIVSRHLRS